MDWRMKYRRRRNCHCERSEAIQLLAKDWIASSQELLAMTAEPFIYSSGSVVNSSG
jgi:hypothetical protein